MSTSPSVIRRFVEYYAGLDAQPPAALAALYHPDATLSDPFGQHQGLFAIQRYFTHLLANVEQCRFTIDTPLCDGQRFAATWTMHWSHPRIAGGETLALPGCSMVDIAGEQVLHQRDYYDAGEMIYEHLPLLGWAVRGVKRRVRS
ncbi:nuclear transport factor 2 family protein [Klebsiella pneumoniae]|uniref:nuclear transport factor 2 family protein n=1 Tax=Klebsiella pneumoniae TaxID=573 RepID=UPI0015B4EC0A|nr:nuclear transport factor 2 family protein [Klebsiella pneumoniae]NWJ19219.1 nuclear transport factor 2 family protein [Klebsiella pneumoniae]